MIAMEYADRLNPREAPIEEKTIHRGTDHWHSQEALGWLIGNRAVT
jgi:hypothetical protein